MKSLIVAITLLVAFCTNINESTAQDPRIAVLDSIYRSCLDAPTEDCLDVLNSGCNRLYNVARDTVAFYTREQIRLAQKANSPLFEARGYNMLGLCTELSGQLDSAITLYLKASSIADSLDDVRLTIDINNSLGIVYSFKGLYETSIEYTLIALDLAERSNDTSRQAALLNNLGLRYYELDNVEVAIDYYERAVEINTINKDTSRLALNYNNLGAAYTVNNDYDKAIEYYSKSLEFARIAGRPYTVILNYTGLATISVQLENYAEAERYNDSVRIIATRINDTYGIREADATAGYIMAEQGEFSKAIAPLSEALDYFDELKYLNAVQKIRVNLSRSYAGAGDYRMAYETIREYAMMKDSLYDNERNKAYEQISIFKEAKQEREKELLKTEIELRDISVRQQKFLRNTSFAIGGLILIVAIALARSFLIERRIKNELAVKNKQIEEEKERSDSLLLNILPASVAEELKQNGVSEARDFDEVTVLFTDFADFTKTTHEFTAKGLVAELNICFRAFDEIITKYGIEKIKTIGDAYMAAGGLHSPRTSEPHDVINAALEMQQFMLQRQKERELQGLPSFGMRVGIHTGNVVAGIVGVKKFQYDIWGDTVNTASRMESHGEVGRVNISHTTYEIVSEDKEFRFQKRGTISVKGLGEIDMWYVDKLSDHNVA